MERRRIRFEGRVQGVGFRATARAIASGFAVSGWVRNEPDGSVLMEVQGAGGVIDECLGKLRGHMAGFISGEDSTALPVAETERGFAIRR